MLTMYVISLFVIIGLVLVFFYWFKLRKQLKRARALYLVKTVKKKNPPGSPNIKETIIVHKPTSPPLITVGPRTPLTLNTPKHEETRTVAPLITSLMQIKLSQANAEDSTTSEDDLKIRYGFKINDSSKTRLKKIFTKDPRPRRRPKEVVRKLSGPTIMGMRRSESDDNVVTLSAHTKLSQYASEPVTVRGAKSIPKFSSSSSEERKNMDQSGLANPPAIPLVRYPSFLLGMEEMENETSLIKGLQSKKSPNKSLSRFIMKRKNREQSNVPFLNELDYEVYPNPFKMVPGMNRNRVSPFISSNTNVRPDIREAAKLKTKKKKKPTLNPSVESVFAWEKSPELYHVPNK